MVKKGHILIALLVCALLLAGCGKTEEPASPETTATPVPTATPAPTEAPTATPAPTAVPTATPAPTQAPTATPAPTAAPADSSYTVSLRASVEIFNSPGYDSVFVRSVGQDGVYTIVEEAWVDGHCWGKLKSGAGWVDLTKAKEPAAMPMEVFFADESSLQGIKSSYFAMDSTPHSVYVAVRALEALPDLQVTELEYDGAGGYYASESYYGADLPKDEALVLEVEFTGDMTCFGLSYNAGTHRRFFSFYCSGRNGALICEEFFP